MTVSIVGGGRYNAPGGTGSGVLYIGTEAFQAGDCYLGIFKWDDSDSTATFANAAETMSFTYLTERHHTASGSALRMQIGYAQDLFASAAEDLFGVIADARSNREAVGFLLRGVTAEPVVSSDNVSYVDAGASLTLTAVDPGGAGIVLGVFVLHETGIAYTVPTGWTEAPDTFGTSSRIIVIYKQTTVAGNQTPSLTFASACQAMGTSIALAAIAEQAPTFVTGYLDASARGKTGLTVLGWVADPSLELATKWEGVATENALDPITGAPAAKIIVAPAPGGQSDGQKILLAVFDPTSDDVSSFGFSGVVTGSSGAIQTLDSPAESLSMSLYVDAMASPNEMQPPHYPEDPFGVTFDVGGAFKNEALWQFGHFLPWGVLMPAQGGHLGPVDKLWIALRKIHQANYAGGALVATVAQDAPEGSVYNGDQASNPQPSMTRQLHPGGAGYGMRIRASECSVPGRYWHFYGAGASRSGDGYNGLDFMVTGYQVRVEADTLADLAAQLPNLRMVAYAGGDLSSPLAGGAALTEFGHGKMVRLTSTWRWVLSAVKRTGTQYVKPNSPSNIAAIQSELSPLLSVAPPALLPALTSADSRRIWWIDPRVANTGQSDAALVQCITYGPHPALSSLSETSLGGGAFGSISDGAVSGLYRLVRGPDPLDSGRSSYLHTIGANVTPYDPPGDRRFRAEIGPTDGLLTNGGDAFWMTMAVKLNANAVDQTSGTFALGDWHAVDTLTGGPSPLSVFCGAGLVTFSRNWNAAADNAGNTKQWENVSVQIDSANWHYFVINGRFGYQPSQSPFLRVWRAVGSAAPELIINRIGSPMGFNDADPRVYWKFGPHWFNSTMSNAGLDTTISSASDVSQGVRVWTKGAQILRDAAPANSGEPVLDQSVLFALMRNQI